MKILYFTDKYTYGNMGTKRSIFEEMKSRNHEILWFGRKQINNILSLIETHKPDQIWLAHSNLRLSKKLKQQIDIPVIGFGFSDPWYFSSKRFEGYDIYVTNHRKTFNEYQNMIPMVLNQTACDFRYHQKSTIEKLIDVSVIGIGKHPGFTNKIERMEIVGNLRKYLGDTYTTLAYGNGWDLKNPLNHAHITNGNEFLKVIQSSKLGLDIQEIFSPMAHRMLEYAACGVPVITRRRPEVFEMFEEDKEILTYSSDEEMFSKIKFFLKHPQELVVIGGAAYARCQVEHNINYRIDHLLSELQKIL